MDNKRVADLIIARLPKSELLTPTDISIACGYKWPDPIRRAVQAGEIPSFRPKGSGKYIIARADAIEWIRACAAKEI